MMDKAFLPLTSFLTLTILVLYAVAVRYDLPTGKDTDAAREEVQRFYGHFTNVAVMIFVGFGFLMTFLKRYSFSAVGFNFLLSIIVFLWNVLCAGFWENVHDDHSHGPIVLSMPLFMEGLFGAGSVMIAYGAVLGRLSASQLVAMAFLQVVPYSLNFYIGALELKASDSGGSMFVHTFGAYFGLAVAIAVNAFSKPSQAIGGSVAAAGNPAEASRTTSDITAMIGTLFLWIYWPSFNGALASDGDQLRVVFNTVIALCGSCAGTFIMSTMLSHDHKFDMVHVQNSTLAGGVAIGTGANLFTQPGGALFIGLFAGMVSVWGYEKLSSVLAAKLGMKDTCGVHNLHGMPGLIGGISGIILAATADEDDYLETWSPFARSAGKQVKYQVYALLITFGIAVASGLLVGWILVKFLPSVAPEHHHEDDVHWSVPDDYPLVGGKPGAAAVRHRNVGWAGSGGGIVSPSQKEPHVGTEAI